MRLSMKDGGSGSAEYKKYRSTDEHIRENREANRLQRERDANAARENSRSSNTHGSRAESDSR